ncbi:MAG: TlpA disulfide reductase family protein [Armatimonadota bacterium]|nr:TlpA disulfide reductase family protein [Armatimonadota bacterium]
MRERAERKQRQKPPRRQFPASGKRLLWIGLTLAWLTVVGIVLVNTVWQPQGRISGAAPSGEIGTRVGDTAPDFRLRDMRGVTVTRPSLVAGKPGLIFFTATWCLPCIEGLRQLMSFERDVGGNRFNVLVVFVDPRETDGDLQAYRQRFGFSLAWRYALDRDEMVLKYKIRYLDTKFVLDRAGVIHYTYIMGWQAAWGSRYGITSLRTSQPVRRGLSVMRPQRSCRG